MINIGDELTIIHEIVDISGRIMFNPGDKVIAKEIMKYQSRWSNFYGMWIEEKIWGIKLENHSGVMFIDCFEEFKNYKR